MAENTRLAHEQEALDETRSNMNVIVESLSDRYLDDASVEFSLVARSQRENIGNIDGQVVVPEASRSKRVLRIVAYVLFCLFVFGALVGLNIFCIYLGVLTLHEECNKALAPWLTAQGFVGLLSTSLVIIVSIPPSVNNVNEAHFNKRKSVGKIPRTTSFPLGATPNSNMHRISMGILGVVQLFVVVWFLVGTTW
eukprot:CAMPEP_0203768568 /NCGR_PEP_ID=MMETSP0099_2-20121227/1667_1 /ASSEMBLY_ACC=CAM_ASM_000209 /TAXON_ID=96639 /ORGANISM=" , Strain NY0313808BC1" /LENGTH=194 /DNA_ID=CAMNT_0050665287 /DNA_START=619 /DNA_END=1200 /DNA_ORIENTATION=-